jgi:hypothetical protein
VASLAARLDVFDVSVLHSVDCGWVSSFLTKKIKKKVKKKKKEKKVRSMGIN